MATSTIERKVAIESTGISDMSMLRVNLLTGKRVALTEATLQRGALVIVSGGSTAGTNGYKVFTYDRWCNTRIISGGNTTVAVYISGNVNTLGQLILQNNSDSELFQVTVYFPKGTFSGYSITDNPT